MSFFGGKKRVLLENIYQRLNTNQKKSDFLGGNLLWVVFHFILDVLRIPFTKNEKQIPLMMIKKSIVLFFIFKKM